MRHPALVVASLALACAGARAEELRNWFDDPFLQVTSALPGCPEPAGPRATAAERQAQSHRRAEKGTTCWLAKEQDCQRSSAFSYDKDIAAEVQAAIRSEPTLARSSLWITVQGRVVYVEGCIAAEAQAGTIEALARSQAHVQQAIAIVMPGLDARPPYKLFSPP